MSAPDVLIVVSSVWREIDTPIRSVDGIIGHDRFKFLRIIFSWCTNSLIISEPFTKLETYFVRDESLAMLVMLGTPGKESEQ
mmetsp:Transcript_19084/g.43447  ORF Transcript_19084/g.43447 Transcript_19084/m.43447 type:complete len:82 (-) Transcript_19084:1907-2152(-)